MLQRIGLSNAKVLEALQQVEDSRWFLVEYDSCGYFPLEELNVRFLSTSRKYFTEDEYKKTLRIKRVKLFGFLMILQIAMI